MSARTYRIDLADRDGAVERLLNKLRRKNLEIETLRLGPPVDGLRRIDVTFTPGCPPAVRVIPNLEHVYDVVAVEAVDDAG